MSLRHALLAILTAEPMTGYDLVKYFDGTVAFVWSAPHSQIYPQLRRMEEEGLIEADVVPRGRRAEKRVYRISDDGVAELRRWARETEAIGPERNISRLRAAFMEWAGPEAARLQLTEHLRHYESWLARWRQLIEEIDSDRVPLLQRRLENLSDAERREVVAFKRFAFEGEIARAETEIAWAKRGLELLSALHPESEESASGSSAI